MGSYVEIKGDLIALAKEQKFDAICHGCNCFCSMKSGIAPILAAEFDCDKFPMENLTLKGNINKLGQIDIGNGWLRGEKGIFGKVVIVNAYTQYYKTSNNPDPSIPPIDYDALTLCMRKINLLFSGKKIGFPGLISCGRAGGDPDIVKPIIQRELKDCDVTIVYLPK